ncbi:hypothetical protein NP493_1326g00001 [Ridgeia piscesae]|uniref:WAP domain-containing protein n=1 Tax=Ridgeia piscesae TaxID=27915 RepID=A0AAD9NDG2_RIDPI|nr:hypothetical protein NP493_1326g00001 [Ridgeia piscesae]
MMTTRVLLLAGVCVLTLCVPAASHAARCPAVEAGNATCAALCPDTVNCPSSQKCCSNGCGHVCMTPTGRTTVIVQLTTDFPWKNEYSTRWGQATIRYILSVTIAQFQKELSHEYLDNPDSPTPDFNLVKDGNRVAVQMAFSHTDTVSRPEVVESRIAWLLAQKYKTTASSSYVIGNVKAIVRSTSGQKLSVKILTVCSIFNAKATCRHGGICVNNDGFPACRYCSIFNARSCISGICLTMTDSDDHEDSRGFHTGKSDSGGSHDSDGEDRDHGSNEDSGDGSRPQLPQPPQLPAWLGGHGGNGSGWFPSFPGFPSFPPQVPTSHPGPSRCQPQRATECIHRLQTSIERAKLPKSTRGSLEALCR